VSTIAIVQARMGSSRFPNKVMQPVEGRPMIELLLTRLSLSKEIDRIIVATSERANNRLLIDHLASLGREVFIGSENDVLDRFYRAAGAAQQDDIIVRITGDCPLVDPGVVDEVIQAAKQETVDYASNVDPPSFPDGIDVEAFKFSTLERTWREAQKQPEREHVTLYTRESGNFRKSNVASGMDCAGKRWTVDEVEDLTIIRSVFEHFRPRLDFTWNEVLHLNAAQPALFAVNQKFRRNQGEAMGKGQKLWKRAKRVIPGGNMLLSKRSEMFLPEHWPNYFSRSKGCTVWDLDGNEFTDFSIMGIGTNILGYGHGEVDAAVHATVDAGNMSTFNCPEEVYLAEKLVEMHPWADMVRFARSGGEANAIAIRIARAASGRDKVAICGYHGWHDWYLAANLSDGKNLAGHLLPGLEPKGVPQHLSGSVLPFRYNQFDELEALVDAHDIGVIKMEVSRNKGPEDQFLQKVRKLATDRGIVLVFDECTSGFRQTFGGLHKLYDVEPDIAIFGKAMGNGYAITSVIGRRDIMEAAQTTFISSTFWTERIGPTAALKTLEVMEREKSWETITATGLKIRALWLQMATTHGFKLDLWGLPALSGFTVQSKHALAYKTLITQEMLDKSYLAGNCIYVSTEHTPARVDAFFDALDPVFALVGECERGRDVMSLLKGPVAHEGFRRLN